MQQKGVTLALETIVVVILAVLVLSVLLYFFSGKFKTGEEKILLVERQRDLCLKYVSNEPRCEGKFTSTFPEMKELRETCERLGYVQCFIVGRECIQTCCSGYCVSREPPPPSPPPEQRETPPQGGRTPI